MEDEKMKKKLVSTLLTVALCSAMLGSTCFATSADGIISDTAAAGGSSTAEGSNDVTPAVFKVVVPTKLTFAVDAFEQKANGEQIYTTDFTVTNKSNLPVAVNIAMITASDTVTLVDSAAKVTAVEDTSKVMMLDVKVTGDNTVTTEKVEVADAAGTAIADWYVGTGTDTKSWYGKTEDIVKAVSGASSAAIPSDLKVVDEVKSIASDYDTNADMVGKKTLALNDVARFNFELDEAEYVDYYTTEESSTPTYMGIDNTKKTVAAFTFTGKVNEKANWQKDDFKITTLYTFDGMKASATPDANVYVAETAPTMVKGSGMGIISITDLGQKKSAIQSIDKVELLLSDELIVDALPAGDSWKGAVVDLKTSGAYKITIDSGLITAVKTVDGFKTIEKVNVKVTYTDKYGDSHSIIVADVACK